MFSKFFIERPIFATVLALLFVVAGINVAAASVAAGVVGDSDDVSAAALGTGVRILHFGSFRFRRAAPHRASNAARSAGAGAGRGGLGECSMPLTDSGGCKTEWKGEWIPRSAPQPPPGEPRSGSQRRARRSAQWWRCPRRWRTPGR